MCVCVCLYSECVVRWADLIRVADRDETFNGEAKNKCRCEVLCGQVDEGIQLADNGVVDGALRPGVLQFLPHVQYEKQRVVD